MTASAALPHAPACPDYDALGVRIAMCRLADWHHLYRLVRECFPQFSASEVGYFVRANGRFSCLAWLDDRPVGYWTHTSGKGPATGWVEQVGVAETYRSIGLGRRLIIDFLQFASWVGFQQVGASILKTNVASLATFRSLGFEMRPDTTDDRLRVYRTIAPQEFGNWAAAATVIGVESDPVTARERFRSPPARSLPEKVFGRIATTLIALAL